MKIPTRKFVEATGDKAHFADFNRNGTLPGLAELIAARDALPQLLFHGVKSPELFLRVIEAMCSPDPKAALEAAVPEAWAAMYPPKKQRKAKATPAAKKGKPAAKKKP